MPPSRKRRAQQLAPLRGHQLLFVKTPKRRRKEEKSMRALTPLSFLVLALAASVAACRSASKTESARRAGDEQLAGEDFARAAASFEKAAALATDPEEKARAYLGAGRAALAAGDPRTALARFHDARRTYHQGPVALATNRGIGAAYLALGDGALARRYLTKGLADAKGTEREETLARLVVASRDLSDTQSAAEYRSLLAEPHSEAVRKILAMTPPPVAAPTEIETPPERGTVGPREDEHAPSAPLPPGTGDFAVIPRQYWNARAPRSNIVPMGQVDKITVHHTGGDLFFGLTRSDAAAEIRRIQRYHQNQQGWADIGYHYLIDRSGNVWQGRRLRYQGAHARGAANHGNIGIVLLGNYLHQGLTAPQRRSLEILVSKLCNHFSIPAKRIYTHREITGGTDCPGPVLSRCVRELREDLRRGLVAYRP
jgi:tetratricopeptide (TPR) repeat protein